MAGSQVRMSSVGKPMLASPVESTAKCTYPLYAAPKLDGIRCIVKEGVAYSRSLKRIPNLKIQELVADLDNLDGELICGEPTDKNVFQATTSAVMSKDGDLDNVRYYVFDAPDHIGDFKRRYDSLLGRSAQYLPSWVQVLTQVLIASETELLQFEERVLTAGYEGLILRSIGGGYKHGRSTLKEGGLLKLKRFYDAEAEVVGFQELQHNHNVAVVAENGNLKRSSHQSGKYPSGVLGALLVRRPDGAEFGIGSGFTAAQRLDIWLQRDKLLGSLAKYKAFAVGEVDAPRFPVFLGFRDRSDV